MRLLTGEAHRLGMEEYPLQWASGVKKEARRPLLITYYFSSRLKSGLIDSNVPAPIPLTF